MKKELLFERMHSIGGMPLNEDKVSSKEINKNAIKNSNYDESPSYQVKLDNISKSANDLNQYIKGVNELPSWVQDKITIAEHNMEAIVDWVKSIAYEQDK